MKTEGQLRSEAEGVGLILGEAAARRVLQLRERNPSDRISQSELILKAVRDMYVVMVMSEDPMSAINQTLDLEEHIDMPVRVHLED